MTTITSRTYEDFSKDKRPADWDGTYYHVRIPELASAPRVETMMLAAVSSDGASTGDWDTVFAVKFKDVNRALQKPGVTPTAFSGSDSSTSSTITGAFGVWALSGGDGSEIHMTLAITSGKLDYTDNKGVAQTVPLAGVSLVIEVECTQLPTTTPVPNNKTSTSGSGGNSVDIAVDTSKPVSVLEVKGLPATIPLMGQLLVRGLTEAWLNDNLSSFTLAFSTVSLNQKAAKDEYQWLKPANTGYAVVKNATNIDDSVFGVLCMLDPKAPVPAGRTVSPDAIPPGQVSGFLISQALFLEKLVMPGIHTLFDGATDADFELTNNGTMIRNKNKVTMEKVGDSKYQPVCDPNTVQLTVLGNTELQLHLLKAVVDFSPGITIVMTYTGFSKLGLDHNSKGEPIITFVKSAEPVVDHNVEVESWVIWTEVAASVVAALITLGTGAAAKKFIENLLVRAVVIVITLLVTELIANMAQIFNAIAAGDKDKVPTISLVTASATDPITWRDSADFEVTSVALNNSLQFGGDPKFF